MKRKNNSEFDLALIIIASAFALPFVISLILRPFLKTIKPKFICYFDDLLKTSVIILFTYVCSIDGDYGFTRDLVISNVTPFF